MNRYKILGMGLGTLLCSNLSAMDQGVQMEIAHAPQPASANLNDLYNKRAALVGGLKENVDAQQIDIRMTLTVVRLTDLKQQTENVQRVLDLLRAEDACMKQAEGKLAELKEQTENVQKALKLLKAEFPVGEIDTCMTQTEEKLVELKEQIKNVQKALDLLIPELTGRS